MSRELISYPADEGIDLAHAVAKASISGIPGVGGPAAELFSTFFPSSLSNRRDEWAKQITDTVNELIKSKIVTIEDLKENASFIDAVIEATIQATRTSSESKRRALASAVSSVARRDIEPDRQHIFLRLIEELTESHIRLLRAYSFGKFSHASGSGQDTENRFIGLVGKEFPELSSDRSFILHLCADLANRSLIAVPTNGPRSLGGMNYNSMRITPSGTAFLKFVGAI